MSTFIKLSFGVINTSYITKIIKIGDTYRIHMATKSAVETKYDRYEINETHDPYSYSQISEFIKNI